MADKSKKIFQPYIFVLLFIGVFLIAFSWFGRNQMYDFARAELGPGKFRSFAARLADAIQSKDVEIYLSYFDPKNRQLREREKGEFTKLLEGIQPDSVQVFVLPRRTGRNEAELLVHIQSNGKLIRYKYNVNLAREEGRWFIKSKEEAASPGNDTHPAVSPDNNAYLVDTRPEEVYSFDKFTVDQGDFHLSIKNGVLVPGFTDSVITAVMVTGNGTVQTLELDGETVTFHALFFRVNPEDYPMLIQNVTLSKIEEPVEQINQARRILDEGLQKSFHVNEFVTIPSRNIMTVRIHTEKYGVLHYFNAGGGFEESKRPERNSARYFFEIGKSCYQLGEIKVAEKYFSKALKAKPRKPWLEAKTRYTLGLVYRDKGEKEKAREQLRKVIEMHVSENIIDDAEKVLVELEDH